MGYFVAKAVFSTEESVCYPLQGPVMEVLLAFNQDPLMMMMMMLMEK